MDDITQDWLVGIARARQDGKHDEGHNRVEGRKGQSRAEGLARG